MGVFVGFGAGFVFQGSGGLGGGRGGGLWGYGCDGGILSGCVRGRLC
jgi:hypothetical protein